MLIGLAVGLAVGGVVGRLTKCRTGACGISRGPFTGALFGGLIGAMIAFAAGGGTSTTSASDNLDVPSIATVEEFDAKVLKASTPVFVDFFATWCGPCHMLEPTIASLEADYHGRVAFLRVDVDAASEVAGAQGITAMPTIIVFRGGNRAAPPLLGVRPEEDYRRVLDEALAKPQK